IVHGEGSRAAFAERWPDVPLVVVPHGDESLFAPEPPPPSDQPEILFFGDWRNYKGLPLLMEVFDRMAERDPEVRLTIAGTPAPAELDPAIVHRWAATHGGRVRLIDHYVPIDDVPAVFGAARVV